VITQLQHANKIPGPARRNGTTHHPIEGCADYPQR
jgi:hypothetical protein